MTRMMTRLDEELKDLKAKNKDLEEKLTNKHNSKGDEDKDKLKPIHHKNIDKPDKYDGNTDHWLRWMKSFKKFMKRQDERWVLLLDEIEKQKGKPITEDEEKYIAEKLKITGELTEFKSQLNEYLEMYTKGNVKQLVEACGDTRSLDVWRQLADKGHSLRDHHKHNLRRKAYFPKQAPSLKEVEKCIAAWEMDIDLFISATGEAFPGENKKMLLIDLCPELLRRHVKDKEHRLIDYESIKTEIADWLADPDNRTKIGKNPGANQLEGMDLNDTDWSDDSLADIDPEQHTSGEILAIVRNKFAKVKGKGKGNTGFNPAAKKPVGTDNPGKGGGNGPEAPDVDMDKVCYNCDKPGHIARNCDQPRRSPKGKGKGEGKNGWPQGGPSKGQWRSWFPGPTMTQWNGWFPAKGKGNGKGKGDMAYAGFQPFGGPPNKIYQVQDYFQTYSMPGVAMSLVEKRPVKQHETPKAVQKIPDKYIVKPKNHQNAFIHVNRFQGLADLDDAKEFPTVSEAQQRALVTKHNKTKPNPKPKTNTTRTKSQHNKTRYTSVPPPPTPIATRPNYKHKTNQNNCNCTNTQCTAQVDSRRIASGDSWVAGGSRPRESRGTAQGVAQVEGRRITSGDSWVAGGSRPCESRGKDRDWTVVAASLPENCTLLVYNFINGDVDEQLREARENGITTMSTSLAHMIWTLPGPVEPDDHVTDDETEEDRQCAHRMVNDQKKLKTEQGAERYYDELMTRVTGSGEALDSPLMSCLAKPEEKITEEEMITEEFRREQCRAEREWTAMKAFHVPPAEPVLQQRPKQDPVIQTVDPGIHRRVLQLCHMCGNTMYPRVAQSCDRCSARDCLSIAKEYTNTDELLKALPGSMMIQVLNPHQDDHDDHPYADENPKIGLRTAIERRPQSLKAAPQKPSGQWEYVEAILDSGATVTVFPPSVGTAYALTQGEAAKAGVTYEVANGEEIPNLGERLLPVMTAEGTVRGVRAQVADVSKPLQAVRQLTRTGHLVVFGDGPEGEQHYVLNRVTGEMNMIRDDGINYIMGLYVMPPEEAGFGRPAAP